MLPAKFGDIEIYRELDILTIDSENEFTLSCNIQFDFCWFEISGWYFGKTAGVLGTMNNEPYDDFMTSRNFFTNNPEEFTNSWSLKRCKEKKPELESPSDTKMSPLCEQFFKSNILSMCSDSVDMRPFLDVCYDLDSNSNQLLSGDKKGPCTAALAYIEACSLAKIPLRVPDQCIL